MKAGGESPGFRSSSALLGRGHGQGAEAGLAGLCVSPALNGGLLPPCPPCPAALRGAGCCWVGRGAPWVAWPLLQPQAGPHFSAEPHQTALIPGLAQELVFLVVAAAEACQTFLGRGLLGGRGGAGGARVGAPLAGTGSRVERAFVPFCWGALDGNFLSPEGQRPGLWVPGPEPTLPSRLGGGGRVAGSTWTQSHTPPTTGRGPRQTRRRCTSKYLLCAESAGQACAPCVWAGTVHTRGPAALHRAPPWKPTGTCENTCVRHPSSQRHSAGQRPGVTQIGTLGPRTWWGAGRHPRQRHRPGWERGGRGTQRAGPRRGGGGLARAGRPRARILSGQSGLFSPPCARRRLLVARPPAVGQRLGCSRSRAREGRGGAPSRHRPPASANNLQPWGRGLGRSLPAP